MKRLVNKMIMLLMAGCIFWTTSGEAKAEKTLSSELATILGGKLTGVDSFYDCGTSTEDGAMEIRSDSRSLKEGDMVEIQIICNQDKSGLQNLYGWDMILIYDEDVLEYAGINVPDEHKIKYGAIDRSELYPDGLLDMMVCYERFTGGRLAGYDENGCVATAMYQVKKDVSFTSVYASWISLTDISSKEYDYYEETGVIATDVLTLNLTDTSDATSKLTLSTTPAQGSKEITVPINIEKNDGFNLLGLTLNYDDSLFTYDSLEIDDSLKFKIGQESIYPVSDSGKVKASFIALEDIKDVGDFLKLKLKVKDGVPAGTTSNVRVEVTQVGNKAETSMSGTGTTCAISITDKSGGEEQQPILGDVNADKKIDLVDAVYILQNYNQVREFTKVQKTAADVDKNGTVNLVDALSIMKYFNGEITGF